MFKSPSLALFVSATFLAVTAGSALAQQVKRTELKRVDLTGTNMEVITALVEAPSGASIPRHFHNGEESFYVLQGGMIEMRDGKRQELKTSTSGINMREVPHGGWKVIGDSPVVLFTTHIVDKGKPLNVLVDQ